MVSLMHLLKTVAMTDNSKILLLAMSILFTLQIQNGLQYRLWEGENDKKVLSD
jgi:hypothetical protein